MEADPTSARPVATPPGGTVEPANRATVIKDRFLAAIESRAERYELRDPFADVTYRANTLPEIIAKATQLGSDRFVAVDAHGNRMPIRKVDGMWRRGPQPATSPERAEGASPERDPTAKATNVVPMPTMPAPSEAADAKVMAKIDAQAERAALIARLEAALIERYVIKRAPVTVGDVTIGRTEYRFRGDTTRVAFTESTFRLATDTNSPSVARSMVDVAEARNWRALCVSGNEDFRRMVWLEASVRGVKSIGYEPNPIDLEVLQKEREARLINRIEPARDGNPGIPGAPTEKVSARGSGGRKAVLAAIEAVLVAKNVPERQRDAVMAAAGEKLAQRVRDGQTPKVKLYDKAAPAQRPVISPVREVQRTPERAAPTR
jgi:hypothetical protein